MKADDYDLADLGITKVGTFTADGGADGWHFDVEHLAVPLPRWLLREPLFVVLGLEVYVRGMHSKQLSMARRQALGREGMIRILSGGD
jgi:hypothetical protein